MCTIGNDPALVWCWRRHERPLLMRRALASIMDQAYPAELEVVLVFDRSEPDFSLESEQPGRRVRVIRNTRTPGLAGARNSGVLALTTDLVAFCDDDDVWLPGKLWRRWKGWNLGRTRFSARLPCVSTATVGAPCVGRLWTR